VTGFFKHIGFFLLDHVVPLPYALYVNNHYLSDQERVARQDAPAGDWVDDEATGLLDRSEQRLQSVETKGTGLATVCGIVAAAIAAAISLHWDESTSGAQAVLVVAGVYSFMSLWTPIRLVGPVRRATVTDKLVREAGEQDDPVSFLAAEKMRAAAENDRSVLRCANQQAASRNDVLIAGLLFGVWALLTLTGIGNVSPPQ
jgi:hypothetical protein